LLIYSCPFIKETVSPGKPTIRFKSITCFPEKRTVTTSPRLGAVKRYCKRQHRAKEPSLYVGTMLFPFIRRGIRRKLKISQVVPASKRIRRRKGLAREGKKNFRKVSEAAIYINKHKFLSVVGSEENIAVTVFKRSNCLLPVGGSYPYDEIHGQPIVDPFMHGRVDDHYPILVEEGWVAF